MDLGCSAMRSPTFTLCVLRIWSMMSCVKTSPAIRMDWSFDTSQRNYGDLRCASTDATIIFPSGANTSIPIPIAAANRLVYHKRLPCFPHVLESLTAQFRPQCFPKECTQRCEERARTMSVSYLSNPDHSSDPICSAALKSAITPSRKGALCEC